MKALPGLLKYAGRLNTEFVWVHHASTVLESTLAHTLNMIGVPTLVVEMGVGMRITEKFCFQLVDGIFCLMKDLGIWDGPVITPKEPVVSLGGKSVLSMRKNQASSYQRLNTGMI